MGHVDEGFARLPGAGYTSLHPEFEGVDPEDYPDITKLNILGDVAPYSRGYNRCAIVQKQTHDDPELRCRYEQIVEQVRQTKESALQVDERRFDAPVDRLTTYRKNSEFFPQTLPFAVPIAHSRGVCVALFSTVDNQITRIAGD